LTIFLGLSTIGLLVSTIVLATKDDKVITEVVTETLVGGGFEGKIGIKFNEGENRCKGMNPNVPNVDCIHVPGPQAGGNVTYGYNGEYEMGDIEATTKRFFTTTMCPVNVHWHAGTEHYSVGEYDENGDGPHGGRELDDWAKRNLAEEDVRAGFRCNHYKEDNVKFTQEYDWKHCKGMEVGETYEVHWPHSLAGACGTLDQYQSPFYDGVFCNLPNGVEGLSAQTIATAVGVQGQIFTVVNDEQYYYPDMIRGMIVDDKLEMGTDVTIYSGSTTGTTRSNDVCSSYAPITWQVDRKCHMISASSFDKLCFDMKNQRADMDYDLHAHGARELVKTNLTANNFQYDFDRRHLWADGSNKLHPDEHHESVNRNLRQHSDHDHHDHDHDHHHHHHDWF